MYFVNFIGCQGISFKSDELAFIVCPGDTVRFICEVNYRFLNWRWVNDTSMGLREYTLRHRQAELVGLTYDLTGVPGVTATLIRVNSVVPTITASLQFVVTNNFSATILSCNQIHRMILKYGKFTYCTNLLMLDRFMFNNNYFSTSSCR